MNCPVCGYDEWDEDEDNPEIMVCRHCGYERSDSIASEYSCENCGIPIKVGDLIIDQASGSMGTDGPNLGDHFIMHSECPSDKLDRFKEKRIKELLEFEFDNFQPQYTCECTGVDNISKDLEEMWPKADIADEFDEMRFILRYGVNMGEIGNIPKDWKVPYTPADSKEQQDLMERANEHLKKLMKEEDFE